MHALKNKIHRYLWTVFVTGSILIGLTLRTFSYQADYNKWTTKIQFQEESVQQAFNGCYKIDGKGNKYNGHFIYNSVNNEIDNTYFGYCQETRQWILFQDDNTKYHGEIKCKLEQKGHHPKTEKYWVGKSIESQK